MNEAPKEKSSPWRIGIILVAGVAAILLADAFSGSTASSVLYARLFQKGGGGLAECLTERGATLYTFEWCPACKLQKQMFGGNFAKLNVVDCDRSPAECDALPVNMTPTWKIGGKIIEGAVSLNKLSETSGCPI